MGDDQMLRNVKGPIKKSQGLKKKFKRSDEKFNEKFKKSGGSKKMGGGSKSPSVQNVNKSHFLMFFQKGRKVENSQQGH